LGERQATQQEMFRIVRGTYPSVDRLEAILR
jgi:hypothetical protein